MPKLIIFGFESVFLIILLSLSPAKYNLYAILCLSRSGAILFIKYLTAFRFGVCEKAPIYPNFIVLVLVLVRKLILSIPFGIQIIFLFGYCFWSVT